MKIYGDHRSGNCYKLELLCALLDLDYEWQTVDIMRGDTRTPDFLARNPNAKVPLLELDDGRCLAESNAILLFLAEGSRLVPTEPFSRARMLQWLFFEQYSHEPYIAVARFIALYLGLPEERRADYLSKQAGGYNALDVMETQLQSSPYLVADEPSLADIALYAYTHVAADGGFELTGYPAITAWLRRIESLPGYQPMKA
ncbi:glutathione S-transferase [Pseudomonas abyssi]|jgi:glutathione S-transferase|uniref:Glutathione S-transferase n=1 Tax=Pseudomonas abyssi TaxID=170540 RepID=A0A2A3MMW1_9PSED|nr:glutathione S-transferase family protein [Pseudomonas abyssi]MAD00431.1 glutathione S-transferase family protein [Pseudomonadales bacterium]PBK06148.1 glutathione S-transferase [Pseudomonas abyssi]|tara:strand:+ start:52594 stop:53193 length:600 start_codon:yes stop_codon:yes gene_type:complete